MLRLFKLDTTDSLVISTIQEIIDKLAELFSQHLNKLVGILFSAQGISRSGFLPSINNEVYLNTLSTDSIKCQHVTNLHCF